MNKKCTLYRFILGVMVCVAIGLVPRFDAYAAQVGHSVDVYVISHDRLLASDTVKAFYVREAVEEVLSKSGIEIVFNQNGRNDIYSINGIKKNDIGNGNWYLYINRDGEIVNYEVPGSKGFLEDAISEGDKIFLYYGNTRTYIPTTFSYSIKAETLNINISTLQASWEESNSQWVGRKNNIPLSGIDVHVVFPDGMLRILSTDEAGKCETKLSKIGYYTFHAEGFHANALPTVVRTAEYKVFYGLPADKPLSRAQIAAYLADTFELEVKTSGTPRAEQVFTDISEDHPYYRQIMAAYKNNVVSGNGDGTFRPNDNVSFIQFSAMLYRLSPDKVETVPQRLQTLPEWAQKPAAAIERSSGFERLPDWNNAIYLSDIKALDDYVRDIAQRYKSNR